MDYFELIIFDCDGVLVDSERLTQKAFARVLNAECGLSLTLEDMFNIFLGLSLSQSMEVIKNMVSQSLPADLEQKCIRSMNAALMSSVKPVTGIEKAIADISLPYCVASSGTYEKMHLTLDKTHLLSFFDGRLFSSSDVARGKPFPDIYLHAMINMGVSEPSKCIVVEDSPLGVQGAKAAGMIVLGYAENIDKHRLIEAGAHLTFNNMKELAMQIKALAAMEM